MKEAERSPSPGVGTGRAGPRGSVASLSSLGGSVHDELFRSPRHAEAALRRMEAYYARGQLCDVTLVAGSRRIRAHRLVLSAASDYFAVMFTSPVLEATQEEVAMRDMDSDALLTLVNYCYTGKSLSL
ncbi:kelch-like protein 1 [Homarus americanus]|nr:kelch-like protein 1 [Homarus americanus]